MSVELSLVVWSVALAIVQSLVAFVLTTLQFDLPVTAPGGRMKRPSTDSLSGRAERASRNMLESLVPFAALMLVTEITNRNNASTGLGGEVFLVARVTYAAVALAGLPWLRTAVWCVSVAALLLILAQVMW